MEVLRTKEWCTVNIQNQGDENEIIEALKYVIKIAPEYRTRNVTLRFSKLSSFYTRKKYLMVNEREVELFLDEDEVCYTTTGRKGYYVTSGMDYRNISSIEICNPNAGFLKEINDEKREKLVSKVLRLRFDNKTWSSLNKNNLYSVDDEFYNVSKLLTSEEKDKLARAFIDKKDIYLTINSQKRDYVIQGTLTGKGEYRAWFDIEIPGVVKSKSYILLNPTTAVRINKH